MNCLIVDDQKISRDVVKLMLRLDPSLVLTGEYACATEAYQAMLTHRIDIIFLDIQMPGMSGLDLARIIANKPTAVIFIAAQPEHAAEAFELDAVDFLVKPIHPHRFLKAVEKARQRLKLNHINLAEKVNEFIFIRDSNTVRKLRTDDILYLEATGNYVKICLADQNYFIHSSLKILEGKFPEDIFLRVHRSFIINLNKLDTIEGKTLVIDRYFIPVSDAYRANLNKWMRVI